MTAKLNNKTIGIPVLRSAVNSVSLLQPTMGLKLDNPTLYTDEDVSPFQTPDGALLGIAFKMNGVNYSIPIYEIPQKRFRHYHNDFHEHYRGHRYGASYRKSRISQNSSSFNSKFKLRHSIIRLFFHIRFVNGSCRTSQTH